MARKIGANGQQSIRDRGKQSSDGERLAAGNTVGVRDSLARRRPDFIDSPACQRVSHFSDRRDFKISEGISSKLATAIWGIDRTCLGKIALEDFNAMGAGLWTTY